MEHLRKQYLKRAPEGNVLGTEEEPVDWATLGLGQKVRVRRVPHLLARDDDHGLASHSCR
jgi:hypothetical protein